MHLKIYHLGLQCNHCNDIIYSRSETDKRYCSCRICYVDGGFHFHRFIGEGKIISVNFIGKNPKLYLWIDWNGKYNKYGLIKDCKKEGITICVN